MSRKKRKTKKKALPLPKGVTGGNLFCGFPLNTKKLNQLWRWDDLSDVDEDKILIDI